MCYADITFIQKRRKDMMVKKALILGISGQDGAYLASLLIKKKYEVWGSSRDATSNEFRNLQILNIKDKIKLFSICPEDFRSVFIGLRTVEPDEVYFLAGQSSVGLSFELPHETVQSITIGTLNVLEASKILPKKPKMYFAGSSECFGDTFGLSADEKTPFNPQSPYAIAKSSAKWLVDNYRSAYELFACTGILFNHESCFRPERFVTKKIVSAAKKIYEGKLDTLELGDLTISRDWGWAPEYVEAMWLMLQQDSPDDFVISTGELNTLEHFVQRTFNYYNLDWKNFVIINKNLERPTDVLSNFGNPNKANLLLKWEAKTNFEELIIKMCASEF